MNSFSKVRSRWTLLLTVGFVLLAGVALQLVKMPTPVAGAALVEGRLSHSIPVSPLGWSSRDLPLGDTELLRDRTADLLRYDDYVYREYTSVGRRFGVYVAYWSPGKMPTRLVAVHTPDRCWTENGWTCVEQKFNLRVDLNGTLQNGVQARVFLPPGSAAKEHVLFWLLVDGEPFDFGDRLHTVSDPVKWWSNVIEEFAGDPKEQYFIRLTSDRPFEQLRGDPGFEAVVRSLAAFGLRAR